MLYFLEDLHDNRDVNVNIYIQFTPKPVAIDNYEIRRTWLLLVVFLIVPTRDLSFSDQPVNAELPLIVIS